MHRANYHNPPKKTKYPPPKENNCVLNLCVPLVFFFAPKKVVCDHGDLRVGEGVRKILQRELRARDSAVPPQSRRPL